MEPAMPEPKTRASIFITCLVDQFYPQVGEAMVKVLRDQGVQLELPSSPDLLRPARL